MPPQRWSYGRSRQTDGEVPADYFRQPEPQSKGMEKNETQDGRARQGTVTDRETGRSYSPYFLGNEAAVTAGAFCFAGSRTVVHDAVPSEPGLPADPDLPADDVADPRTQAVMTDISAYYEPLADGATCATTGTPRIFSPALTVISMASGSAQAQQWRETYVEEGTAVQTDATSNELEIAGIQPVVIGLTPSTAYVLQADGRTSALLEVNGTTLIIQGPYTKTELIDIAQQLEVL